MAKKKNNVLDKKVKVEGHKFTIKQLLIIILIVALVSAGFCTYCYFKPFVDAYLLGDNIVTIRQGEEYEEPGWVFTYNFREVDDENVSIKYTNSSNTELKNIDTNTLGVYTVTYHFNYKRADETLKRYVSVIEPTLKISLKGGNITNVPLNGDFNEEGFTLLLNDKEVTPDSISITYKNESGVEISSIDTTVAGTYTVTYVVTYNGQSATMERQVIVSEVVATEPLSIHFLELGNEFTGDSVYIKAGETDILIDAGSNYQSAETIKKYVNNYCTDGKLEYVIATHNHTDHIASFAGNSNASAKNFKGEVVGKTGLFYYYDIDTLIDFNYAEVKINNKPVQFINKEQVSSDFSSSSLYGKYLRAREYAISKGTNYYTAGECFNDENGASRVYNLSENISLEILYNYYYFNAGTDQNDYSVCAMINYGKKHFMFTGDLELEGEEHMAAYYDGSTEEKTLPHVAVLKAGHHGSKTSTNDCLLEKITPDIVCVCCCAGSVEYTGNRINTFPTQAMIDRVANYTDKVYVTSAYDEVAKTFVPLNGTIVVTYSGIDVKVEGSSNSTILKDSDWFNGIVYQNSEGAIGIANKQLTNVVYFTEDTEGVTAVPRRIWPTTA